MLCVHRLLAAACISASLVGCSAKGWTGRTPVRSISIERFCRADIRFAQIDADGLVTSVTHFFRELPPEGAKPFTVTTADGRRGTIALYRLRNIGTGEIYEFRDIPVRTADGEIREIEKTGWEKIRDELQGQMRLKLALPILHQ